MRKKIIFCGTPEFSIASLNSLFQHQAEFHYNLVGVITIPDQIAGRGQKKQQSPVKREANHLNIPVYEPQNLNDDLFLYSIKALKPDLIFVVAFKKLPEILFKIPTIGTINIHASLLPKYRGAAPINWAIINGEKQTGLTTFFINNIIDTGDIITQIKIKIEPEWNAGDLYTVLMDHSNQIIKDTLDIVLQNNHTLIKQNEHDNDKSKYAPKLKKQDFSLPLSLLKSKSITETYNFIRGMSPPGVKISISIHHLDINKKTSMIKKHIIITRVNNFKNKEHQVIESDVHIDVTHKNEIKITNGTSSFNIMKLKLENGKEISAKEFYNGFIKTKHNINKISIIDRIN